MVAENKAEPYTPTTEEVRNTYEMAYREVIVAHRPLQRIQEFDRWYVQEIEKAEYSGYLRAVREGLHR